MRSILLASTVAALTCVAAIHPARAILGVGDVVIDPTAIAQQAKDMLSQLNTLHQQYDTLRSQLAAISHVPQEAMGAASSLTQMPSLQNPFPQAGSLQGLLNGSSPLSSATTFLDGNRVYAPSGTDFAATEMLARGQSTANLQSIATGAMQAIERRASSLREFFGTIGSSPDVQETSAIQARLAVEQNFVSGQQVQATQLANLIALQNRVDQQRASEAARRNEEELQEHTASAWDAE